jgi:hypothetical protein
MAITSVIIVITATATATSASSAAGFVKAVPILCIDTVVHDESPSDFVEEVSKHLLCSVVLMVSLSSLSVLLIASPSDYIEEALCLLSIPAI